MAHKCSRPESSQYDTLFFLKTMVQVEINRLSISFAMLLSPMLMILEFKVSFLFKQFNMTLCYSTETRRGRGLIGSWVLVGVSASVKKNEVP